MEIYNGTEHRINIYSLLDTYSIQGGRKLIRKECAEPIAVIEAGTNLQCIKDNLPAPNFTAGDIPLNGAVVFKSYDPLPREAQNKIVVVSNIYRSAVVELGGDTSMLATIDGAVYEDESAVRPCGCLGLAVG